MDESESDITWWSKRPQVPSDWSNLLGKYWFHVKQFSGGKYLFTNLEIYISLCFQLVRKVDRRQAKRGVSVESGKKLRRLREYSRGLFYFEEHER